MLGLEFSKPERGFDVVVEEAWKKMTRQEKGEAVAFVIFRRNLRYSVIG